MNKQIHAIKLAFAFTLLFLTADVSAQKKRQYTTEQEAVSAATEFLDKEMKSGEIKKLASEHNIQGEYLINITIGGKKGQVYTVTPVERSEEGSINGQNTLKNFLKAMRMPFKMPKDQRYKFQYTFTF